jgi:hypothetical protein
VCFAAKNGPEASTAYPIETFRQQDGLLWLKEPPALPKDHRTVWIKTTSPTMLVEKLVDGLTESGSTPVADAFAAGRLGTTPARDFTVPPGLVGN